MISTPLPSAGQPWDTEWVNTIAFDFATDPLDHPSCPAWWTRAEVARRFRVCRDTVTAWINTGLLPHIGQGKALRVHCDAIRRIETRTSGVNATGLAPVAEEPARLNVAPTPQTRQAARKFIDRTQRINFDLEKAA